MPSALTIGPMEQLLLELNSEFRLTASLCLDPTLTLPASVAQRPAAACIRRGNTAAPARGKKWTPRSAGKTSSTCIVMVGSGVDMKQPIPTMQSSVPGVRRQLLETSHARSEDAADLHATDLHNARGPYADRKTACSHTLEHHEQVEGLELEILQLHSEVSDLREQLRSLKSQLHFKDGLLVQAQQALTSSSEMHAPVRCNAVSPPTGLAPPTSQKSSHQPKAMASIQQRTLGPATPTAILRASPPRRPSHSHHPLLPQVPWSSCPRFTCSPQAHRCTSCHTCVACCWPWWWFLLTTPSRAPLL